jgi:hypothetical protein
MPNAAAPMHSGPDRNSTFFAQVKTFSFVSNFEQTTKTENAIYANRCLSQRRLIQRSLGE